MEATTDSFYVYFVACSVNLISFASGIAFSWTSPMLPRFESNDPTVNPIARPITSAEAGLLVSFASLGLLVGPFLSGPLVGKLGKKTTILAAGLPMFLSHVLCATANNFALFLITRLMMGASCGAVWAVLPGYVSDISRPENRGILSATMITMCCLGTLYTYVIGPFVTVRVFSLLNLIPTGLNLVVVYLFVPPSPYDLVVKNRLDDAKMSLMALRRRRDVNKELLAIEKMIASSKDQLGLRELLNDPTAVTALKLCLPLMLFNAFSGIYVVLGYTQTVFEMAGSSLSAPYSAMLVGVVAVSSSTLSMFLLDFLGRKPIIYVSSTLIFLTHGTLGIYFRMQQDDGPPESMAMGWIPVVCVTVFTFSYYFGLSSLPWIVMGELFATNARAVASTICAGFNFTLAFVGTLLYSHSVDHIGMGNTYLVFAAMGAACLVFSMLKLPETKGKSFEEIYALLNQRCEKS